MKLRKRRSNQITENCIRFQFDDFCLYVKKFGRSLLEAHLSSHNQCLFFSHFYLSATCRFFGNQTVERLDLCSMLKKKQQDGYYHTETSLQLG